MKFNIQYDWNVNIEYLVLTYLSFSYDKNLYTALENDRYDKEVVSELYSIYKLIDENVDLSSKDYEKLFKPLMKEDINNDVTLIQMAIEEMNPKRSGIYKLFSQIWDQDFESNDDLIKVLNNEEGLDFEIKYNILNAVQSYEQIYAEALLFIEKVMEHHLEITKHCGRVVEYMKSYLNDDYIVKMLDYLKIDLTELKDMKIEVDLVHHNRIQMSASEDEIRVVWGVFVNKDFNYQTTLDDMEEDFLEISKYLSDPTKLEIVKFCLHKERYAKEIAEHLDLSGATVSHHMNMLTGNNYVTIRLEKRRIYYKTNTKRILDHISYLDKLFKSDEDIL